MPQDGAGWYSSRAPHTGRGDVGDPIETKSLEGETVRATNGDEPFGCDTMVALAGATADGQTLFAKNSDRTREECQPLMQVGRAEHGPASTVPCDFREIPQVGVTYAHVGSRPHWSWGYEHGFNEHQVAIGNEALFSRFPESEETRLTGMDLVRLGLERGRSASESVEAITDVVTRFGQGRFAGNSEFSDYDNGLIVADPREAYIIETAGHEWAVKRVDRAIGISNVHSIVTDWTGLSPGAERTAIEKGWWTADSGRFDFREAYLDVEKSLAGSGANRRARSCAVLEDHDGAVDLRDMIGLVGDHSDGKDPHASPGTTIPSDWSVCMHYGEKVTGNTAATLIAHLCDDGSRLPVYWCSFYSPCLGVFLPTFSEGRLPKVLSVGGERSSDGSPWWLFRELENRARRGVELDPDTVETIRAGWAPIQDRLIESAYEIAREASDLITRGESAKAEDILTEYMESNTRLVLGKVRELLSQTAPVPVGDR